MACINGQMGAPMKVLGRTINFMERESIVGLMEEFMMDSTSTTKSRASEAILGQMEGGMRVTGIMGNSMEKGSFTVRRAR